MSGAEQFDVIIPAGGRTSGEFALASGVAVKALIRMDGQSLLARTIETLRQADKIRRIVVIGDQETQNEAASSGADGVVKEGRSGPDNIMRGLAWLREQEGGPTRRLLIITSDLPFLTVEALRTFIFACPNDADIAVAVVTQQAFDTRFPDSGSVYTVLRDGSYTVGGVFLLDDGELSRNRATIERLFNARKSQWRMAKLIGPRIAWRFLTRQLTVPDILKRVKQEIDCNAVPIFDCPPELAFDIDDASDLACARRILESDRKAAPPTAAGG